MHYGELENREYNKKNITRPLEDMNFIFSWQKTIFYSLAALVRKILFAHSKIKFISSRHRVISSINLSLFVENSHRSSFDPESKLWKLALLIGVFY